MGIVEIFITHPALAMSKQKGKNRRVGLGTFFLALGSVAHTQSQSECGGKWQEKDQVPHLLASQKGD